MNHVGILAGLAILGSLFVGSAAADPVVTVAHSVDPYGAQCFGVFNGPEDFSYTYVVLCAGKTSPLDCPVYIDVNSQNGGVKTCV